MAAKALFTSANELDLRLTVKNLSRNRIFIEAIHVVKLAAIWLVELNVSNWRKLVAAIEPPDSFPRAGEGENHTPPLHPEFTS
jgi:hypothetical protein